MCVCARGQVRRGEEHQNAFPRSYGGRKSPCSSFSSLTLPMPTLFILMCAWNWAPHRESVVCKGDGGHHIAGRGGRGGRRWWWRGGWEAKFSFSSQAAGMVSGHCPCKVCLPLSCPFSSFLLQATALPVPSSIHHHHQMKRSGGVQESNPITGWVIHECHAKVSHTRGRPHTVFAWRRCHVECHWMGVNRA